MLPYCGGDAGQPNWALCTTAAYWQELEARHGDQFLNPDDLTEVVTDLDPEIAAGQMVVTQLYAMTMMQGISSVVEQEFANDEIRLTSYARPAETDPELAGGLRLAGTAGKFGVKFIANKLVFKALNKAAADVGEIADDAVEFGEDLKLLGKYNLDNINSANPVSRLKTRAKNASVVGKGLLLLTVGVTVVGYLSAQSLLGDSIELNATVTGISLALTAYTSIYAPLATAANLASAQGVSTFSFLLRASEEIGQSVKANVIGAVVAIGLTWGFFIYGIAANGITAFSPEFNRAAADTIATTIYILLMSALSGHRDRSCLGRHYQPDRCIVDRTLPIGRRTGQ